MNYKDFLRKLTKNKNSDDFICILTQQFRKIKIYHTVKSLIRFSSYTLEKSHVNSILENLKDGVH